MVGVNALDILIKKHSRSLFFKVLLLNIALLFTAQACAMAFESDPRLVKLLDDSGVNGTFVLYDVAAKRLIGAYPQRAATRYLPASTFKIPNTLIGLSTGAVSSVDEIFPYDGTPRFLKSWEKDMGLREAIQVSNLPVYQQLARRIGLGPMKDAVLRLEYGNEDVGEAVDKFWIAGPLKISAIEQVEFLGRLARRELPFTESDQAIVRDIIELEKGEGWTLYGKTGWASAQTPNIGWWVGWVEQNGKFYSFALNMDVSDMARDAPKRIELGKAALRTLGLLPVGAISGESCCDPGAIGSAR